ncbi:hypothetical protein FQZ97_1233610 [compost metagenome]
MPDISAPEMGPPSTMPSGIAKNRIDMMRDCRSAGYHLFRYITAAGKKPASVTPSRKRAA